jgi:hypothetical protein
VPNMQATVPGRTLVLARPSLALTLRLRSIHFATTGTLYTAGTPTLTHMSQTACVAVHVRCAQKPSACARTPKPPCRDASTETLRASHELLNALPFTSESTVRNKRDEIRLPALFRTHGGLRRSMHLVDGPDMAPSFLHWPI